MESNSSSSPRIYKELLKFLVTGGIAVGIDALAYVLLLHFIQMEPAWAKRLSFAVGSVWAFFANKYFTFAAKEFSSREPFLFLMVYIAGWMANSLVHDVVLYFTNWKIAAFIAATGISSCTNFVGMKFLVFRQKQIKN
ncbi:MAG: GtrA family protein [Candidatus Methylacidiphilales bacterium]|nr:GtrA family protein [Candidatus Methylacidiphilales bacterium]